MLAKAAIVRGDKEVVSETADVNNPGDLEALVAKVFDKARKLGVDLWNFTLQVTKAR
jgi:hypothetical protein